LVHFVLSFFNATTLTSDQIVQEKYQVIFDFEKDQLQLRKKYENEKGEVDKARFYKEVQVESAWNYLEKAYPKVKAIETDFIQQEKEISKLKSLLSLFSPVLFYFQTTSAVSGTGSQQNILFTEYSNQMQENLLRFFIEKQYPKDQTKVLKPGEKIEHFIRGDENVFYSRSLLPDYYWWNLLVTLVYILILMLFTAKKVWSYLNVLQYDPKGCKDLKKEILVSDTAVFYIYARSVKGQDNLFNYFSDHFRDALFIDAFHRENFFYDTSLKDFLDLLLWQLQEDFDPSKFETYKQILEVGDLQMESPAAETPVQVLKKLYLACKLANNKEMIFIKGYFQEEDLEFRGLGINLIKEIYQKEKRTIAYIGKSNLSFLVMDKYVHDHNREVYDTFKAINISQTTENFTKPVLF
jgi:hypothetical protein